MSRRMLVFTVIGLCANAGAAAAQDKWATVKGQVIWTSPVPKQAKVNPKANELAKCVKDKAGLLEEDFIINPKNKGIKDVVVWIRPDGLARNAAFPKAKIHPDLAKPPQAAVEIDQPCCRFIPHLMTARAGQTMIIKNSAPFAHNAKWTSENNRNENPLIPPDGQFKLPDPLKAEWSFIDLQCNLHPWMKAYVMVFDHPYYAVTDEDGRFEIKMAPAGKFKLFVRHPVNGFYKGREGAKGIPVVIKDEVLDLGTLKMELNQ